MPHTEENPGLGYTSGRLRAGFEGTLAPGPARITSEGLLLASGPVARRQMPSQPSSLMGPQHGQRRLGATPHLLQWLLRSWPGSRPPASRGSRCRRCSRF